MDEFCSERLWAVWILLGSVTARLVQQKRTKKPTLLFLGCCVAMLKPLDIVAAASESNIQLKLSDKMTRFPF